MNNKAGNCATRRASTPLFRFNLRFNRARECAFDVGHEKMKSIRTIVALLLSVGVWHNDQVSAQTDSDWSRPAVAKRRAALDRIMIPLVEFEGDTAQLAVDFAWARTVELDNLELDPKQKGISISIRYASGEVYPRRHMRDPDPPQDPNEGKILYSARDIPLTKLLVEIAKQAGFDVYTTSAGVVFCPPGTAPFPNRYAENGETWEALFKVPRKSHNEK